MSTTLITIEVLHNVAFGYVSIPFTGLLIVVLLCYLFVQQNTGGGKRSPFSVSTPSSLEKIASVEALVTDLHKLSLTNTEALNYIVKYISDNIRRASGPLPPT